MGLGGYAAEGLVALLWVAADVYLFTHPWIEILGTPWIPFLIVTAYGVAVSYAVNRAVHGRSNDL